VILPTERLSVYDFTVTLRDLVPSPAEAATAIGDIERRYPDLAILEREIDRWWDV
jgi:hypothetical protein